MGSDRVDHWTQTAATTADHLVAKGLTGSFTPGHTGPHRHPNIKGDLNVWVSPLYPSSAVGCLIMVITYIAGGSSTYSSSNMYVTRRICILVYNARYLIYLVTKGSLDKSARETANAPHAEPSKVTAGSAAVWRSRTRAPPTNRSTATRM